MPILLERAVGPLDHVRGNLDAPVTLVEYGDFACHYCALAFPIVEELRSRFPDSLRFVFRHAPQTRLHPTAAEAAEAAEAAGAQQQFWAYHDRLFVNRAPLDRARLDAEARALGLDMLRFAEDLDGHRFRDVVKELERSGARSVRGTPTFFVNGVRYEGPSDVDSLVATIDAFGSRIWPHGPAFAHTIKVTSLVASTTSLRACVLRSSSDWAPRRSNRDSGEWVRSPYRRDAGTLGATSDATARSRKYDGSRFAQLFPGFFDGENPRGNLTSMRSNRVGHYRNTTYVAARRTSAMHYAAWLAERVIARVRELGGPGSGRTPSESAARR